MGVKINLKEVKAMIKTNYKPRLNKYARLLEKEENLNADFRDLFDRIANEETHIDIIGLYTPTCFTPYYKILIKDNGTNTFYKLRIEDIKPLNDIIDKSFYFFNTKPIERGLPRLYMDVYKLPSENGSNYYVLEFYFKSDKIEMLEYTEEEYGIRNVYNDVFILMTPMSQRVRRYIRDTLKYIP